MSHEAHLVLLKQTQKEVIELPINVVAFTYNDSHRAFHDYKLDFGRIAFHKVLEARGTVPLRCIYDTRQGIPFWFLMEIFS